MKLKITFSGPKVHEAAYLLYLTELAFSLALRGFEIFNDELNGQQAVVALIEGDEMLVNRFHKIATSTQPPLAGVEIISSEDYPGEIMPAWQFASIGTFSQMNKAIPLLLEMRDDIKAVRKNTDILPEIQEDVRGIRETSSPDMRPISGRCRRISWLLRNGSG